MTWTNFKNYLEEKILQEEENNEEETSYTLHPSTKTKYSPTNEKELITTLTNLILSIDNLPYHSSSNSYSSLSEQDNDYHSLPELDNLYTDSGKLIIWSDLFPKREEVHFGKKEDIEGEISPPTWKLLTKIFNDWVTKSTRSQRLASQLDENTVLFKFLVEAVVNLNYDLIKRKGYDIQLRNWLQEYNQLEESEQAQLTKQKEMVTKLLTALEEEEKNRQQESSWYHNILWTKVIWYGGGGLLLILVLGWLHSKLKK